MATNNVCEADLKQIAGGKYAQRLIALRQKAKETPAEECYLLLNVSEIGNAADAHFAYWAYKLESLRDGLILLPVFITWFSLGLAVFAYIQTYKLSPDPFLKQWADGFPGAQLPIAVPGFVTVAMFDAFLIFSLILLTVIAQVIEGRARKRVVSLCSWLDEELYQLASSSLVKSLGDGPDNKQPAWAVEVHTAIHHLTQAVEGVEHLVHSSEQTIENLMKNSQTAFSNLVAASQEKFEGSVREFREAMHDQRMAIENFTGGTTEVRRVVDKLEKIYVEGEHIYQGLNKTLPRIDGSFKQFAVRQDAAATALESMSSYTNHATEAISSIAEQFVQTQLVKSTSQAANKMYETAETMSEVVLSINKMHETAEMMSKVALSMKETVDRQIELQKYMEQPKKREELTLVEKSRTFLSKLLHR